MQHEIRQALALTGSSTARERTVDITTTGRHRVLSEIVADLNQPHNPARIAQPTRLEDRENGSPLVEIVFDDQAIQRGT
jgi:hypothetical protein